MKKMTFKEFRNGKGFASYDLREREEFQGLKDDDIIISFAYTDYGGDFFDKVAIEYFIENFKNNIIWEHTSYFGKNAIVYREIAKEFLEAFKKYPLGFRDIEDYYFQKQYEAELEGFKSFLEDSQRSYCFNMDEAIEYLNENKSGYYSLYPSGLDFNWTELENELIEKGIFKNIKVEA